MNADRHDPLCECVDAPGCRSEPDDPGPPVSKAVALERIAEIRAWLVERGHPT